MSEFEIDKYFNARVVFCAPPNSGPDAAIVEYQVRTSVDDYRNKLCALPPGGLYFRDFVDSRHTWRNLHTGRAEVSTGEWYFKYNAPQLQLAEPYSGWMDPGFWHAVRYQKPNQELTWVVEHEMLCDALTPDQLQAWIFYEREKLAARTTHRGRDSKPTQIQLI